MRHELIHAGDPDRRAEAGISLGCAESMAGDGLLVYAGAASKPPAEAAVKLCEPKAGVKIELVFGGSGAMLSPMNFFMSLFPMAVRRLLIGSSLSTSLDFQLDFAAAWSLKTVHPSDIHLFGRHALPVAQAER